MDRLPHCRRKNGSTNLSRMYPTNSCWWPVQDSGHPERVASVVDTLLREPLFIRQTIFFRNCNKKLSEANIFRQSSFPIIVLDMDSCAVALTTGYAVSHFKCMVSGFVVST